MSLLRPRVPTVDPSLLLVFPLLLALSTPCHACECKLLHPQMTYCMSDAVIVADVLGPANNTAMKRVFKINVIKILKVPKEAPDFQYVYTPWNLSQCGYQMSSSEESQLLIAGYVRSGKLLFTRCHLAYSWNNLTREQKLGFESEYRKACGCQVQTCYFCTQDCPEPDPTECVWKQKDCEYGVWKRSPSTSWSMCMPSESGQCEWTNIHVKLEEPTLNTHTVTNLQTPKATAPSV